MLKKINIFPNVESRRRFSNKVLRAEDDFFGE